MNTLLNEKYWDSIAEKKKRYYLEEDIEVYKRTEHIKLIEKWADELKDKIILKTDLYEEAFRNGDFLFWLLGHNINTFGLDISHRIAKKAKLETEKYNVVFKNCITSDLRMSAFKDETFDIIISNSTLDHLAPQDVTQALTELKRILKPHGIIILTLDNGSNPVFFYTYLIRKILNLSDYYLGQCYSIKQAKNLAKQTNLIIQDIDFIVHIYPPFTAIVRFLKETNIFFLKKISNYIFKLFLCFGKKRAKFLTGWFIALKLVKK